MNEPEENDRVKWRMAEKDALTKAMSSNCLCGDGYISWQTSTYHTGLNQSMSVKWNIDEKQFGTKQALLSIV